MGITTESVCPISPLCHLSLHRPRPRGKKELPGSLREPETGGNQPQVCIPVEKLSPVFSRVYPGSSFYLGLFDSPCWHSMCLFISFPVSVPLHSFPLSLPPLSLSPPLTPAPTLSPFISVSLLHLFLSLLCLSFHIKRHSQPPPFSSSAPAHLSHISFSSPWNSLITFLLSHPPLFLSPSVHLCISLPLPWALPSLSKSHIEIGATAIPLPHALVSPVVGWLWSLPKSKGRGSFGERGGVGTQGDPQREFLNPSMTPDTSPAQSDSCIAEEDRLGPQSPSFLAPHPHGSPS